ncbi:DUF998 domain-containing protein [Actinomadura macrotermitis]|uniref:DUF998 domain-containing protein n=1 Tax=Actinomadura macrotermitis TaxID=2585200 RepID=A0A7K0BT83_9ACTN|nr:DUF998 domain-containing protein [Actinomadura macrotermitis]MQY04246.1 hypothetical protein [Actinomadura macrotermitis]
MHGTRPLGDDTQPLEIDNGPGRAPLFAAVLALAAAVAYGTFPLEHLLSPALDSVNGYVSELAALDQPHHLLYGGGDLLAGALSVVVAVVALATLRRRRLAVAGWVLLALFGCSAVGDAVFPMSCAPNHETWCALRDLSDQVPLAQRVLHPCTTGGVIVFGLAALATLTLAARRYGWWPALARWGWPLTAAESAAAVATLATMVAGRWPGVAERVQIGVLCLGLLAIAWALYAEPQHGKAAA